MKNVLEKLLDEAFLASDSNFGMPNTTQVADHLLKNGVVVLPCKVGDIVYRVGFAYKKVEMLNVEGILRNVASWKVHCTHFIPNWVGNKKEHIYISFSQFGKTLYFTKEEAEKALAEGCEI